MEVELVFVAAIDNRGFNVSKAISKKKIEQWEIKTVHGVKKNGQVNGVVRVRAYDDKTYETTVKFYHTTGADGGNMMTATEHDIPVSKEYFNTFKKLAPVGYTLERYVFPIEGSKSVWEMDVYYDEHGKRQDWVKFDLEFDPIEDARFKAEPPPFPVDVVKVYGQNRTKEEEAIVSKIFDTVFSTVRKDSILPIHG